MNNEIDKQYSAISNTALNKQVASVTSSDFKTHKQLH